LVDERDLESIRLKDYRNQLGVVLQDNFLFDGTIADNISFLIHTLPERRSSRPVASRIARSLLTALLMAMTQWLVNEALS